MILYPHCQHCCWGHEHHPDNEPGHTTPCWSGCLTGTTVLEEGLWT